jgi:hypothetical protein
MTSQRFKRLGGGLLGAGVLALGLFIASAAGPPTPTARADGPAPGVIVAPPPASGPASPIGRFLGPCPPGTILIWFEQPVYDRAGLFVIGHKLVPYCIPEDLEPAG